MSFLYKLNFKKKKRYFVIGNGSQLKICITSSGKVLHNIPTSGEISHLEINPSNNEQFYSSSKDGLICLWNGEENTKISVK